MFATIVVLLIVVVRRSEHAVREMIQHGFLFAESPNQLENITGFSQDFLFRSHCESIHEQEFNAVLANGEVD